MFRFESRMIQKTKRIPITKDTPLPLPFTILVDTAEGQPFDFSGFRGDAKEKYRPLVPKTRYQALGRHPNSKGDYSIEGLENWLGVERKSLVDAQATLLGFSKQRDGEYIQDLGRRDRFEKELDNLSGLHYGAVIVEATVEQVVQLAPEWGKKPRHVNAKILHRTILAYQQDYRVPWHFCDGRRMAELTCLRVLQRAYRKLVLERR